MSRATFRLLAFLSLLAMAGWIGMAAPLAAQEGQEVRLFNGKNFSGWTYHLRDSDKKLEEVWSIDDGVLTCKGDPRGYLRTEQDYTNYVLKLEWRFPGKPGNSGVLLRMVGEDKVWPKSIEAQLHHQNAGDIWNIDKFPMKVDPARTSGRRTVKLKESSEKPLGDWNEYEIALDGPKLTLKVNRVVQNEAAECEVVPGKICLQSEGAEVQFRNIRLIPLKP